jgi:hypothetical protein
VLPHDLVEGGAFGGGAPGGVGGGAQGGQHGRRPRSGPHRSREVLDIEDVDVYRNAFANPSPEIAELIQQVFSYVDDKSALDLIGEVIE